MKYCPNCGTENKETAKFCTSCGYKLIKVSEEAVISAVPVNPTVVSEEPLEEKKPDKKKKGKRWLAVLLIIFLIVAAGVFVPPYLGYPGLLDLLGIGKKTVVIDPAQYAYVELSGGVEGEARGNIAIDYDKLASDLSEFVSKNKDVNYRDFITLTQNKEGFLNNGDVVSASYKINAVEIEDQLGITLGNKTLSGEIELNAEGLCRYLAIDDKAFIESIDSDELYSGIKEQSPVLPEQDQLIGYYWLFNEIPSSPELHMIFQLSSDRATDFTIRRIAVDQDNKVVYKYIDLLADNKNLKDIVRYVHEIRTTDYYSYIKDYIISDTEVFSDEYYQNNYGEKTPQFGSVKILVDELRIRNAPSTSGKITGHAVKGKTYVVLGIYEKADYTWYCIGEQEYIASKQGTWTDYHP